MAASGPEGALDILKQQLKVSGQAGASTSLSSGDEQNERIRVDGEEAFGSLWRDEKYLTPFLENDSLLYTFDDGEGLEFEDSDAIDGVNMAAESLSHYAQKDGGMSRAGREHELTSQLSEDLEEVTLATQPEIAAHASALLAEEMSIEGTPDFEEELLSDGETQVDSSDAKPFDKNYILRDVDGISGNTILGAEPIPKKKKKGKVTFAAVAEKEKLTINRSYFGSYSGFGIHREMLGDKVSAAWFFCA